MSSAGTILRMARERQGLSLDTVAESTRINKKILKDIEDDALQSFPETYIRAFQRAYAEAVGLDSQELLKRIEPADSGQFRADASVRNQASGNDGSTTAPQSFSGSPGNLQNKQRRVLIVFSLVLVAGLAVSLYSLHTNHKQPDVKETAFQDVIQEWNAKFSAQSGRTDSSNRLPQSSDSLKLLGVAADSVWIRLKVDNEVSHNYLLKPQQRMHWQAGDSIVFSVGNAGGIAFTLNGLQMGLLGKKGRPLRNISFTAQTVKELREGSYKSVVHEKN